MKMKFFYPWATAVALGAATGANAAVVMLTNICTVNCSELGLAPGSAVSAVFEVNASAAGNQTLGRADVTGFSINLGNIAFDYGDLSNWDFFLTTDAAGTVSNFQFLASFGGPGVLADTVDMRMPWWGATHQGACRNDYDGQPNPCDFATQGNNFGYAGLMASGDNPEIQLAMELPEPSALALAGLALGALAAVPRSRKAAARKA